MKNLIAMSFKEYFDKIEQIEKRCYEGTDDIRDTVLFFSTIIMGFIFLLTSLFLLCATFFSNIFFVIPLIFTTVLACLFGGTAIYLLDVFRS